MAKRIFEMDAQGKKCQNGNFLLNSHFGTFFPVHQFQIFFLPDDFSLSIVKDLLHTLSKKVSLALSRPVHVLIQVDKLNYFKFPLIGFQKFFLICVAGMILEARDEELERAYFSMFQFCL